jgi:hypothetical protein
MCLLFGLGGLSFLRAQEEPAVHLNSIRNAPNPADKIFLDHVLNHVLDGPQDQMFISNRDLLLSLCVSHCSDSKVLIHDTLEKRRILDIALTTKAFDPSEHSISYFEGADSLIETIDGQPAYGGIYAMPTTEIATLTVTIKGKSLDVPPEAFANLYNPNLCESEYFRQAIAAYPSLDGKYLYLYLYGGKSSDTYFAKLVFDRKRFLKKIVAEYPDLSDQGAIREDFIGF